MTTILIWIVITTTGAATQSQEFSTQQQCEEAKTKLEGVRKSWTLGIISICVKK